MPVCCESAISMPSFSICFSVFGKRFADLFVYLTGLRDRRIFFQFNINTVMNDNAKVVVALLAGLAAGAALGILFAPDKGTETREKLNDSLKDLGEAIKERTAEQLEHLNDFKEKVVAAVKSKLNKSDEALEGALEEHA